MPWTRVDDGWPLHRKVALAGPEAAGFWVAMCCYANRNLTDGHVPKDELHLVFVSVGKRRSLRIVSQLLEQCLVKEWPNSWEVHDFLEYNDSAAIIQQKRTVARDKKRRQRGHVPGGQQGDLAGAPVPTPTPTPDPVPPSLSSGGADLGTLRGLDTASLPPPPDGERERVAMALKASWSDAWIQRTTMPATDGVLRRAATLAPWLIDYAKRRTETAEELAPKLIAAFFEAKAKVARPNVAWLIDEDPGRYLEDAKEAKRDARKRRDVVEAQQASFFDRQMAKSEREAVGRDEMATAGAAAIAALKGVG